MKQGALRGFPKYDDTIDNFGFIGNGWMVVFRSRLSRLLRPKCFHVRPSVPDTTVIDEERHLAKFKGYEMKKINDIFWKMFISTL